MTKVIYKPTSEVKRMWITSAADGPSTSHTLGFIYIYIYFFFLIAALIFPLELSS